PGAAWMLQQSIAPDDAVVFMEPKRRYWEKGDVETSGEPYPLHASRVARAGSDCTVVAYGPMVRTALDAAIAADGERSLEVIDLRSLSPLALGPVYQSVGKPARL